MADGMTELCAHMLIVHDGQRGAGICASCRAEFASWPSGRAEVVG